MTLLLERHEVEGLLDLKTAIEITRAACVEQGGGRVLSKAPTMLHVANGALRIVQGALLDSNVIGARLTKAAGFKSGGSLAVICRADTGELLAVMSFPLGALRTGAVVGLSTELLSRKNAEVVGLIGTGQNAMSLLQGIICVRPVKKIKVYSRDAGHRNQFAAQAASVLGVEVSPCTNAEDTVRGSDILLVATNSKLPVFDAGVMEPGLHVNSMGRPSELTPAVYRRAALTVVGDKQQELNLDLSRGFTQPLLELKEEPGFWPAVLELGDVACGRGGRNNEEGITVFRESQGGWGDIAFCNWILQQATKLGLGREVSF